MRVVWSGAVGTKLAQIVCGIAQSLLAVCTGPEVMSQCQSLHMMSEKNTNDDVPVCWKC